MSSVSYAITACNEHVELKRLLTQLVQSIKMTDEIVLQLDTNATEEVKEIAAWLLSIGHKYITYPLNNDFANFKNNLKSNCQKDYIFFIDADEYLSESLLAYLPIVLKDNPEVDLFVVPRVNTVSNLTQEWIARWGWRVDNDGRVNWPDYQTRICKNSEDIKWQNKVHEQLTGWKSVTHFPDEDDTWALYHPKTIERQIKQNLYYDTL